MALELRAVECLPSKPDRRAFSYPDIPSKNRQAPHARTYTEGGFWSLKEGEGGFHFRGKSMAKKKAKKSKTSKPKPPAKKSIY